MTETDYGRLIALMTGFKDEIKADFRLYLGIQTESILRQLDLVIEGQRRLLEKMDRLQMELGLRTGCEKRQLAIATDLKAHRADTEAHHALYRVKE